MKRFHLVMLVLVLGLVLSTAGALSASPTSLTLSRWTVDGGGGTSTGAGFTLAGTIGQPDVGPTLSGGTYQLVGGFWRGTVEAVPDQQSLYLPIVLRRHVALPYAPLCGPANSFCEDYDERLSAYGPLHLDVPYQAYPDDEFDWYYFLLASPRRVTVQVTDFQTDGQLRVYDGWPDTDKRYWDYEEEGHRDGILEIRDLDLAAGTYYIRIFTDIGAVKDDALYTLTVNDQGMSR